MAYNVFKRPMFKRGGSTTGTGIMSHVEPRTIGGGAISGNNMSNNRTGFQAPILTIGEGMASELARGKPGFTSTPFSPALSKYPRAIPAGIYGAGAGVGIGLGSLLDFYARGTKTPEEYRRLQEMSEFGIMDETNLDVGDALKYIEEGGEIGEAPGLFPRGGRKKFFEEKGLDPKTGLPLEGERTFGGALSLDEIAKISQEQSKKQKLLETKETIKDEPAYEGTDIKSEVKRESEMLRELLKDDKYSRGEAALIIAGALAEPGSFSDKVKKATELAAPVARKRREEDKAITLAAYKAAKEKEKYETRYGQDSDTIRFYKERANSLVGTPGYKDKTADQIYRELMSGSAEARVNILKSPQTAGEIKNVADRIARLNIESKTAKPKRKEQIVDEILQQKTQLEFLIKMPEFESIYPGVKESLGYKYGGRVMKAIGGDVSEEEDTDMQASDNTVGMAVEKIGEGSGSQTVSEPVQRLSYQELRDRLPQEITDDVVSLLSNSEEALQEFAYIRTQDDVNSFNTKYGVNLVIPPTRG